MSSKELAKLLLMDRILSPCPKLKVFPPIFFLLDEADEDLIRSELASAEAAEAASNNELMASTARKESEQQTDITYGQSNKKIQVTNTLDDQNSDVDEDVETTSSVLSQSLRSTHSNGGGDPSRFVFFVCILFFFWLLNSKYRDLRNTKYETPICNK